MQLLKIWAVFLISLSPLALAQPVTPNDLLTTYRQIARDKGIEYGLAGFNEDVSIYLEAPAVYQNRQWVPLTATDTAKGTVICEELFVSRHSEMTERDGKIVLNCAYPTLEDLAPKKIDVDPCAAKAFDFCRKKWR